MPRHLLVVAVLVPFCLLTAPVAAQVHPRPRTSAVSVPAPPVMDGEVSGDPAWAAAPVAGGFIQQNPDEGQPASERTEVRIVQTTDTLYIGVLCFDSRPGDIVLAEGRRDAPIDKVDSFRVLLDTFLDRQNAFMFGTTPAGGEFDGQVINDGGGNQMLVSNAQQGGSLSGFNLNWDGAWEVRTKVGPLGWSAELAIPFRTLRYAGGGKQSWGVNFQRVIQRRNETVFWAPLGRQQDLTRVSWAGTLDGMELPPQRNLKLIPYVLGRADRGYLPTPGQAGALANPPGDWDFGANAGGDLKYSVTPSLTLDATVRTDFAQVEVDEQQLQLDRFNLFFPEKRPFFLENAGFFSVGQPGDVDLFFSRRIGIAARGEVIPILGGGRLSGKLGPARLGLLNMQTEEVDGVATAANFTVARFGWELGNRSSVGAFFSNRQATGEFVPAALPVGAPVQPAPPEYGRTYAADGRLGIGEYGLLSGFAAATESPGSPRRPFAWNLSGQYDSPDWLLELKLSEVGEGFDPQLGFLKRRDYRRWQSMILHRYRPQALLGLKELTPHVYVSLHVKPDGFMESRYVHVDNYAEWPSGLKLASGVNFTGEGVVERFEIDPVQHIFVEAGSYNHTETHLELMSPAAWPVFGNVELTAGGFFGGTRLSPSAAINTRAGDVFSAELRWEHNRVDLPAGDFVVNLGLLRLSYSFTPRAFVQALVQYNDRSDVWSTNLRLGWLRDANTGLFVVYNENRGLGPGLLPEVAPDRLHLRDRSVVLKLSLLLDVLR